MGLGHSLCSSGRALNAVTVGGWGIDEGAWRWGAARREDGAALKRV